MLHTIYHFLGVCGEPHPSLWWVLLGSTSIGTIWSYIKNKLLNFKKQKNGNYM